MSRSYKKNPITGITCCRSEKKDKRHNNRKLRRKEKVVIKKGGEDFPVMREVSDVWKMGKDGKVRWSKETLARMPKLIRK